MTYDPTSNMPSDEDDDQPTEPGRPAGPAQPAQPPYWNNQPYMAPPPAGYGYGPGQPPYAPPAVPSQPVPASARSRLMSWFRARSRAAQFGLGCGALIVICLLCTTGVGVLGAIAQSGNPSAAAATATTAAAPTNTPKPTATKDPNANWQDYTTAIMPDASAISGDLTQIGTDCGNQDFSGCDTDAHTLASDVQTAQQDLNQHPAPPCLKSFDTQYRATLAILARAAKELYTGIENLDASQISAATSDMRRATTTIDQATATLGNNTCPAAA